MARGRLWVAFLCGVSLLAGCTQAVVPPGGSAAPSSVVAGSPSPVPPSPSPEAEPSIGAGDFGPADVAAAVETLAGANVTVRETPDGPPMATVAAPSRLEFLRFQVRNMALEATSGGGTLGVDWDAFSAANDGLPVSYLVAGWARVAGTPAAEEAAALLGDLDGVDPPALRVPMLAVALFLGDVAPPASGGRQPRITLAADEGFCDEIAAYLAAVVEGVVDPAAPLQPPWLQAVLAEYGGTLPDDPDQLRAAVSAMALLVYAASIARPWAVSMSALPLEVHHIVGEDELSQPSKHVLLTVNAGPGDVSEEIAACTELADAQLADIEVDGTPVDWIAPRMASFHGTDIEGDLELEDGGATYEYQTVSETKDAHENGTQQTEMVPVGAILTRRDIREVSALVQRLLTGGSTGVAAPTVAAMYARLATELETRLHPAGGQAVYVTWHVPKEPTPSPKGAVRVRLDRQAEAPMLAGTVLDVVSCTGPVGQWAGVMRVGGLQVDDYVVPFAELPVAFTITAEGVPAATTVSGTVPTPSFTATVTYEMTITVTGDRMSIHAVGSGDTGLLGVGGVVSGFDDLPIEPAPDAPCP